MTDWLSRRYQELSVKDLKTSKFSQQEFQFRKTIEHGVPTNAKVLAWDPIQELLALGTTDGCIVVYGKVNVDQRFHLTGSPEINYLFFRTNEGFMIAITSDSCIHVCSLHHRGEVETYSLGKNKITSVCAIPGYSYVYIGDENGGIKVFDTKSKKMALYEIRLQDVMPNSDPVTVVDIQVHPEDMSKLLIGYFTGDVVLWDLKTRKVVRSCSHRIKGLTSICWSRSGDQFASGYHNGEIIIWNSRNFEVSQHALSIGGPKNIVRSPIKKLRWSMPSIKERSVLYAIGGVILPSEPEDSVISIFGPAYSEYHFAHIGKVSDFIFTSNNPWLNGPDDPQCLITLPSEGGLQMYRILPLGFPPLLVPSIYNLNSSRIISTDYQPECPKEFIDDLRELLIENDRERLKLIQEYWPMKNGGHTSPQNAAGHAILATGHTDGFVRIWDVSNANVSLIAHFDALKMIPKKPSIHSISLIRVCTTSRTILIGFLGGEAHVFKFKKVVSKPGNVSNLLPETSSNAVSDHQVLREGNMPSPADQARTISVSSAASKSRLAKLSGFYYANVSVTHQGRFSSVLMHTGLKRLALGDESGQLSITDLETGVCLIKCSLGDRRSPVLGLSVADLAISPNAKNTAPILFVSLEIGSVYCLDLNTFEIILNLKPSGISPVLACFVVDDNAQPLIIPSQHWEPTYEEEQVSEPVIEEKETPHPDPKPIADDYENVTAEHNPESSLPVVQEGESAEKGESDEQNETQQDAAKSEEIPESANEAAVEEEVNPQNSSSELISKVATPEQNESSFVVVSPSNVSPAEIPAVQEEKKQPVETTQKSPPARESNSRRFGFISSIIGRMSHSETKPKEEESKVDSHDDRTAAAKSGSSASATQLVFPIRYMVQVCSKFIRLYTFPTQARLLKITPTNDIIWASLINYNGDVCLFTYDYSNTITIYALLDLKIVATLKPENDGPIFESDMRFRTCVHEDGRIITSLDGTQISRYSIILEENILHLPASLPIPFTSSRVLPPRPSAAGLMNRLLGGFNSQTDLNEIFPLEASARSRLFGDRQEQSRASSAQDLNTPASANEQAQSVASAVNETRDLLIQRGERLSELQNATSQLESQAQNFLQLARELRQEQENKKWWEI